MESPLTGGSPQVKPHSRTPAEASIALGGVMGTAQLAWPFMEIDRADPTDFINR